MTKWNKIFAVIVCGLATAPVDAAVVQRNSRSAIARTPTTAIKTSEVVETTASEQPVNITDESVIIENKTTQFDTLLNKSMSGADTSASDLADKVRAQRAALDTASGTATKTATAIGTNACDATLRSCMTDKCGNNFIKCASDTDTMFGTKLDSCRRDTNCGANEFSAFSAEIKADRATAIQLKSFNEIIDCGNEYDACIIKQCGTKYSNCLGRSAETKAISACASIATKCKSADSGLASRTSDVLAILRQNAEKQIAVDEKTLYSLRDQMKTICSRLGAMFDERSMDCVYTVNFYAGDDNTLYSSQKRYAGDIFSCTPAWFGIDVTTFMENAYRTSRAQKSASSAMLGAGVGMAVGALTSGAIGRAIDTQNAAKDLCDTKEGMKWSSFRNKCVKAEEADEEEQQAKSNKNEPTEEVPTEATAETQTRKQARAEKKATTQKANDCTDSGGKWENNACDCTDAKYKKTEGDICVAKDKQHQLFINCEQNGGIVSDAFGTNGSIRPDAKCICPSNAVHDENWNCPTAKEIKAAQKDIDKKQKANSADANVVAVPNPDEQTTEKPVAETTTETPAEKPDKQKENCNGTWDDKYNLCRCKYNVEPRNNGKCPTRDTTIYDIRGLGNSSETAQANWKEQAKLFITDKYCSTSNSTITCGTPNKLECTRKKINDYDNTETELYVYCGADTKSTIRAQRTAFASGLHIVNTYSRQEISNQLNAQKTKQADAQKAEKKAQNEKNKQAKQEQKDLEKAQKACLDGKYPGQWMSTGSDQYCDCATRGYDGPDVNGKCYERKNAEQTETAKTENTNKPKEQKSKDKKSSNNPDSSAYICDGVNMEPMIKKAKSLEDLEAYSYKCWKQAASLYMNDTYCDSKGYAPAIHCPDIGVQFLCESGKNFDDPKWSSDEYKRDGDAICAYQKNLPVDLDGKYRIQTSKVRISKENSHSNFKSISDITATTEKQCEKEIVKFFITKYCKDPTKVTGDFDFIVHCNRYTDKETKQIKIDPDLFCSSTPPWDQNDKPNRNRTELFNDLAVYCPTDDSSICTQQGNTYKPRRP